VRVFGPLDPVLSGPLAASASLLFNLNKGVGSTDLTTGPPKIFDLDEDVDADDSTLAFNESDRGADAGVDARESEEMKLLPKLKLGALLLLSDLEILVAFVPKPPELELELVELLFAPKVVLPPPNKRGAPKMDPLPLPGPNSDVLGGEEVIDVEGPEFVAGDEVPNN
jgi:hypothetical protein